MEDQVDDAEIDQYIRSPREAANDKYAADEDEGGRVGGGDDAEEGEESDPNAFEVETIKAVRKAKGRNNKYEYKVSWKGYGSDDDTWEPRENLQCDELLKAFENSELGKRMFAECQQKAAGGSKRTSAPNQRSSKPSAPARRSTARASSPDDDDEADDWSETSGKNGKKRKQPGNSHANGSKMPVRRRQTAPSESDDEVQPYRGGKHAKNASSAQNLAQNSHSSTGLGHTSGAKDKHRLPIDKTTENFLKNDAKPAVKYDTTDYDDKGRVGVAAVRHRNPRAEIPKVSLRDYGVEWKRRTISDGVRAGYALDGIISVILHNKTELVYMVDWKQSKDIDLVEHDFLLEFYPKQVFDYIIDRTETQSDDMLNLMLPQQSKEEKKVAAKISNGRRPSHAEPVDDAETEDVAEKPTVNGKNDDEVVEEGEQQAADEEEEGKKSSRYAVEEADSFEEGESRQNLREQFDVNEDEEQQMEE